MNGSLPAGNPGLDRAERRCLAWVALGIVAAIVVPALPQDSSYHAFADQRRLGAIPHAADVLSNLGFLVVGALALGRLASSRRADFPTATQRSLWCVALGLVLTSLGSAWYHLDPDDTRLVWDRLPITLVFAGVFGAAIAQRVSMRLSFLLLPTIVLLGFASVACWHIGGNLSPYLVLQAGGAAALLAFAVARRNRDDPFPWLWVIGWYAIAKVAEVADRAIYDLTSGFVAGHALKHAFAALAGAAAVWPLLRPRETSRL